MIRDKYRQEDFSSCHSKHLLVVLHVMNRIVSIKVRVYMEIQT